MFFSLFLHILYQKLREKSSFCLEICGKTSILLRFVHTFVAYCCLLPGGCCFCGDPYVAAAAYSFLLLWCRDRYVVWSHVVWLLLLAAYFAVAIGLKPLLLMGNVAAYLGRGYVVWQSGSLGWACVVWSLGGRMWRNWKKLEEMEWMGI